MFLLLLVLFGFQERGCHHGGGDIQSSGQPCHVDTPLSTFYGGKTGEQRLCRVDSAVNREWNQA